MNKLCTVTEIVKKIKFPGNILASNPTRDGMESDTARKLKGFTKGT